jgi:hypothetical protein
MTPTVKVGEILNTVSGQIEELNGLKALMSKSFNEYNKIGYDVGSSVLNYKSQIRDLKEEQTKYDKMFEDEQKKLSDSGGKTREQTLQEFVILFFYIGYIVLSITLAIFFYTRTQSTMDVIKILGLMFFIGLVITALILRLA